MSSLSGNRVKNLIDASWGCSMVFSLDKSEEVIRNTESLATDDGEDNSEERHRLNYFKSSLFASVLEDTITQIRILAECNNEFRILKTMTDIVQLRAQKYSVEQPALKDELDGINPKELGKEEYKLEKLSNDRTYLYESLILTYLDLSLNRAYMALVECIADAKDRELHHDFLVEDEAKNKLARRELVRQLRQQRNHIKSVNYDTDLSIDELKTQVEDIALESEIRSRYITNWQVARTEQHHQAIRVRDSRPMINIEYYKTRADHEQRVHTEVEVFTNITIHEKLEMVESWMNKYDKDMEKMDLKIQIKKNDYTLKLEYRIQLEETFAKHEKLMKDWEHFKDEREKARQYVEKMTNAATVVQAWWRGLLVRLQLGPYKPVKKPGGKGAKKK